MRTGVMSNKRISPVDVALSMMGKVPVPTK
jgi:hypothetical protein